MRLKFIGKYGDLKKYGFYYSNHDGANYIHGEEGKYSAFLMISRSMGRVYCEQHTEVVLTELLPFLDRLDEIPKKLYLNIKEKTFTLSQDDQDIHYNFTHNFEGVMSYKEEHGAFPEKVIYRIHNEGGIWKILLDMYRKNMFELNDDWCYDVVDFFRD